MSCYVLLYYFPHFGDDEIKIQLGNLPNITPQVYAF